MGNKCLKSCFIFSFFLPAGITFEGQNSEGGCNHFELRRYKRAYTLPGVFKKGDVAPPMREAALWLEREVLDK